jgi:hypothetical protein
MSRNGIHGYYISYLEECKDVLKNQHSTLVNTSVPYLQIHTVSVGISIFTGYSCIGMSTKF